MIEEEGLSENAAKMGEIFSRELSNLRPDIVLKMRGVGLFWAMVINRKGGRPDIHLFFSMKLTLLCLAQLPVCKVILISCFSHRYECVEPGRQASWQRTALQAHSLRHTAVCPFPDHHRGTSARVMWHYQENCGSLLRSLNTIITIFIAQ